MKIPGKIYWILGVILLTSVVGAAIVWPSKDSLDQFEQSEPQAQVGAWFFPGFCQLGRTLEQMPSIDVIKPQWAYLSEEGGLRFYNDSDKCDGFSPENVEFIKSKSQRQYLNVVSLTSVEPMRELFASEQKIELFIDQSREFLLRDDVDFDGIEVDFERSLEWSEVDFENYLGFLTRLKEDFDRYDLEILVDMPAIDNNQNLQENHPYKYSQVAQLDLDGYVLMIYDNMYSKMDPAPIAPVEWAIDVVNFAKSEFGGQSGKLIGGIHSYGYRTKIDQKVTDPQYLRYVDIIDNSSVVEADRVDGGELTFVEDGYRYFFADSEDLFVEELGLNEINVWQIIGNPWLE